MHKMVVVFILLSLTNSYFVFQNAQDDDCSVVYGGAGRHGNGHHHACAGPQVPSRAGGEIEE